MENQSKPVMHVGLHDGAFVSVVGDTYRLVMTGQQTGGAFAVIDMRVPPGGGPGPHAHAGFQETFHVLDGEIEVRSETGVFVARKGDFVTIPAGGVIHQFKNKSSTVAHLWCTVVPAGLDAFFQEIGQPVHEGEWLQTPALSPADMARLETVAARHGQKLFPPDFLEKG